MPLSKLIITLAKHLHCREKVCIRIFSSQLFPAFYSVCLCIWSERRKIRNKKAPNTDNFYAVLSNPFQVFVLFLYPLKTSENLWFTDPFGECEIEAMV